MSDSKYVVVIRTPNKAAFEKKIRNTSVDGYLSSCAPFTGRYMYPLDAIRVLIANKMSVPLRVRGHGSIYLCFTNDESWRNDTDVELMLNGKAAALAHTSGKSRRGYSNDIDEPEVDAVFKDIQNYIVVQRAVPAARTIKRERDQVGIDLTHWMLKEGDKVIWSDGAGWGYSKDYLCVVKRRTKAMLELMPQIVLINGLTVNQRRTCGTDHPADNFSGDQMMGSYNIDLTHPDVTLIDSGHTVKTRLEQKSYNGADRKFKNVSLNISELSNSWDSYR